MEKIYLDVSSYSALKRQLDNLFGPHCGYHWYYSDNGATFWTYNTPHNMHHLCNSRHWGAVAELLYALDMGTR